ncbi:MAG: lysophospholipid acyltransferase family protein [Wenzhouxiangellaceae bacterium]
MSLRVRLKRRFRRLAVKALDTYVRRRGSHGFAAIQRDGDRLGRLHHFITPMRRRRLAGQMARLFGPETDPARISGWLHEAYRINDRAVLELMAQARGAVEPREIIEAVEFTGAEALLEQAETGRGAVLLGMHSGNVFALMLALDRTGVPITVVANQSRKLPDGFFRNMFAGSGVQAVDARPEFAAFYNLDKALKRGRAVFIPMDQIHKQGDSPTMFLGKRVNMPPGAAALARKHRVPVFPVLLEAAGPRWTFRIDTPVHLPEHGTQAEDVAELSKIIDGHIRRHPGLWSWHQRRWVRYPFAQTSDQEN